MLIREFRVLTYLQQTTYTLHLEKNNIQSSNDPFLSEFIFRLKWRVERNDYDALYSSLVGYILENWKSLAIGSAYSLPLNN